MVKKFGKGVILDISNTIGVVHLDEQYIEKNDYSVLHNLKIITDVEYELEKIHITKGYSFSYELYLKAMKIANIMWGTCEIYVNFDNPAPMIITADKLNCVLLAPRTSEDEEIP